MTESPTTLARCIKWLEACETFGREHGHIRIGDCPEMLENIRNLLTQLPRCIPFLEELQLQTQQCGYDEELTELLKVLGDNM